MDDSSPAILASRIQKYLTFLLKFWWIPLVTLILSLIAVIAHLASRPPTFVSQARMWQTVRLILPEGSMFSEDGQNYLGTQTELLQSTTLRELALARLRTLEPPVAVPLGEDRQPLPVVIRVTGSKSSMFTVAATSSHAAYTRAYLDALIHVFLDYKKTVRREVSGETLSSITAELLRWEEDMKNEQEILMAYERTNNSAILQEEGRVSSGYLAKLKTQLSDLQMEERLLKATELEKTQTKLGQTNASANPVGEVLASASPTSAVASGGSQDSQEVELLKFQRERLSRFLRPKHPKIVKLDKEIERGEKLTEIYRRQSQEQLVASRQAMQLKISNILTSISEWEGKVVAVNGRIGAGERLRLNVRRVESVYDRLVAMVQSVGISRNIDHETLAILETATSAIRSYSGEVKLVTMAIVGGLALGVGIVLLVAVRDDRFTSFVEVNEKFGDAIVGQVPEVTNGRGDAPVALLGMDDQRHMYAEAYRSLRSALLYLATEGERPKVLLITSAVPNEGKSTIAANLARTLALGGSRVLLIDADMRKGHLDELMGMQREPGLAELLRQPGDLEKIIQRDSVPNLAFIARGSHLSNPGDVFLEAAFDQVLSRLREQFDYVVIDSSPIFAADDATTLAPKVDGTLLVIRSRFSRAGQVREALELLYQRQAKVLGLVFNRADSRASTYYYYKHADYYPSAKTV